jgi:hypothetical protein
MEKCIYKNKVLVNVPNTSTYKIDTNKIDKLDDLFVINDNKIAYKEPYLYILEKKESQCNNTTEQWQKWFTTSYYYLGNKDGRRKIDENSKTRQINLLCYKECSNNSILNKDEICENIETFEKGKYNNYLPYDPLAIICILGSHGNNIINRGNILGTTDTANIYEGNHTPEGNYYHTIQNANAKIDNYNLKINGNIQNAILNDINAKTIKNFTETNSPLKIIIDDTTKAYKILEKYIQDTIENEEQNELNIKTIIKNEVNKFFILFDKRDELYINYLKKLKDGTHYKRIEYAKNVAEIIKNIEGFDIITMIPNSTADKENIKKYYLNYLFQYCVYIYFDKKNIIPNRFLNFGIYEKNYLLTGRTNPDIAIENKSTTQDKIKTYNPISVKIETKEKNMFDEYLNVYELYISFITTYPIILIAILILFMIIYILHLFNIIYYLTFVINYIYLIIIWLIYILIIAICCNSWIIGGITYIIAAIYNTSKSLYTFISYVLYFLKYFIIIYFIYLVITNQINYIYDLIMFMVDTIVVIGYSLLISAYNIIFNTNTKSILIKIFIIYVIIMSYIFYKVWFNFDIDMILKIETKTSTNDNTTSTNDNTTSTASINPISEHRNINTILYSDSVDAADIALQRVNLYKYKYFINLYEGAYKFYTDKVSYLDDERKKNYIYKNNTTEIYNEDYKRDIEKIENYGNKIEYKNIEKFDEFKKNIEKEGLAKEAKRAAEEELQKTRDKLKELKIEKLKNTFNKEKNSIIKEKLKNIEEEEKNRYQILKNNKKESERLRISQQ